MDSVPLEMDDIFGEYENDDDGGGFNPSALPDLEDELEPMRDMRQENYQGEDGDGEVNAELLAQLKNMKGATKNTTKRVLPKLDAARLTGERGIAVLPKTFEGVPLKGKNHEAQDLKLIMHTLQHWGHRLFPKMTFDEVLERVERLGAKKEVQTTLKRIRLDMPVLVSDFAAAAENEDDDVQRAGDNTTEDPENDNQNRSLQQEDGDNNSHDEISDSELDDLLREQQQPVSSQMVQPQIHNPTTSSATPTDKTSGLSDEVRKRIEENKRKALERRAAKMAGSNDTTEGEKTKLTAPAETSATEHLSNSSTSLTDEDSRTNTSSVPLLVNNVDSMDTAEGGTGPFEVQAHTEELVAHTESMECEDKNDETTEEKQVTGAPTESMECEDKNEETTEEKQVTCALHDDNSKITDNTDEGNELSCKKDEHSQARDDIRKDNEPSCQNNDSSKMTDDSEKDNDPSKKTSCIEEDTEPSCKNLPEDTINEHIKPVETSNEKVENMNEGS